MISKLINGEELTEETVIIKHGKLVHSICKKHIDRAMRAGYDREDLYSVGCIGLLKAYRRFDGEAYKVRFSSYAYKTIDGEMRHLMRDSGSLIKFSRGTIEAAYKITNQGLVDLPVETIAKELGIKVMVVEEAFYYIHYNGTRSLDKVFQIESIEEGEVTLHDVVPSHFDNTEIFVEELKSTLSENELHMLNRIMAGCTQTAAGIEIGKRQSDAARLVKSLRTKITEYAYS